MIIIQEYLPNPAGPDSKGEYIALFNDGDTTIVLDGWQLKDASGKTFTLSGSIAPQARLILPRSQTKIAINNNSEQILLYDPAGRLVDSLSHKGSVKEGVVVTRKNEVLVEKTHPLTTGIVSTSSQSFPFLFMLAVAAITSALFLAVYNHISKKTNEVQKEKYNN